MKTHKFVTTQVLMLIEDTEQGELVLGTMAIDPGDDVAELKAAMLDYHELTAQDMEKGEGL